MRIYLYMHKWSLEGSTWNKLRVGVQELIKLGLPGQGCKEDFMELREGITYSKT